MSLKTDYKNYFKPSLKASVLGYALCVFMIGQVTWNVYNNVFWVIFVELTLLCLYEATNREWITRSKKNLPKSGFTKTVYFSTAIIVVSYVYFTSDKVKKHTFEQFKGNIVNVDSLNVEQTKKSDSLSIAIAEQKNKYVESVSKLESQIPFLLSQISMLSNKKYLTLQDKTSGNNELKQYKYKLTEIKAQIKNLKENSDNITTPQLSLAYSVQQLRIEQAKRIEEAEAQSKNAFIEVIAKLSLFMFCAFLFVRGMVIYQINSGYGFLDLVFEKLKGLFVKSMDFISDTNTQSEIEENTMPDIIDFNKGMKPKEFDDFVKEYQIEITYKAIKAVSYRGETQRLNEIETMFLEKGLNLVIKRKCDVLPNETAKTPIIILK